MTLCAACGLPGHRYGRNEGMDRFDPIACINQLRGELEKRTLPGFTECPECAGSGTVITEASNVAGESLTGCPSCSGLGVVPDPETVETVAQGLFDHNVGTSSGSAPPFGEFQTDEVYRIEARAALLAYARKAKEQT